MPVQTTTIIIININKFVDLLLDDCVEIILVSFFRIIRDFSNGDVVVVVVVVVFVDMRSCFVFLSKIISANTGR